MWNDEERAHSLQTNRRIRYLVANGFQLLADDKLTTEEWKKLRIFSKEKIEIIAERALSDFRLRMEGKRSLVG